MTEASCLVTGATGFVGRALCRRLQEENIPFATLQRTPPTDPGAVANYLLDLADPRIPDSCFHGIQSVVHLAGVAHGDAPDARHDQINQQATLRLAGIAAAAGVHHFVFLSSVKAMGCSGSPRRRGEDELAPAEGAYGRSKRAAEIGLELISRETGMRVTVLRPALVYGPGVKANVEALIRAVGRGIPGLAPGGRRSMVALDDLVAAILTVLAGAGPGYSCYLVCGERDYSARDIQNAVLSELSGSHSQIRWTLPMWAWRLLAGCRDLVQARQGPGGATFAKLFGSELYNNQRLQRETGWIPQSTLEQQLPAILETMKMKGTSRD